MVHFPSRLKNTSIPSRGKGGGYYKVSSVVQALLMFILTRQNVCVELMKHWSVNHIYRRVPMGAGIVCQSAPYLARFSSLSCRPRNTAQIGIGCLWLFHQQQPLVSVSRLCIAISKNILLSNKFTCICYCKELKTFIFSKAPRHAKMSFCWNLIQVFWGLEFAPFIDKPL